MTDREAQSIFVGGSFEQLRLTNPAELMSEVELCSVASAAQKGLKKMKEVHYPFLFLLVFLPLVPPLAAAKRKSAYSVTSNGLQRPSFRIKAHKAVGLRLCDQR